MTLLFFLQLFHSLRKESRHLTLIYKRTHTRLLMQTNRQTNAGVEDSVWKNERITVSYDDRQSFRETEGQPERWIETNIPVPSFCRLRQKVHMIFFPPPGVNNKVPWCRPVVWNFFNGNFRSRPLFFQSMKTWNISSSGCLWDAHLCLLICSVFQWASVPCGGPGDDRHLFKGLVENNFFSNDIVTISTMYYFQNLVD